jgi:bifunctional DNA-binding transcriptional regulator/antitoxin component of YhaV-PrlF toxin-antitoxin module
MHLLRMFAKVDHEGKISLPRDIQRELGMSEGQLLELKISGSGKRKTLVIVPHDQGQ